MQQSALDMVRARAAGHLGKARDAQARAIARARLMRDDAKLGSRQWNDANAVVEDLEAVGRLLDGVGEAVAQPPVKPATEAASPQRQAEQAAPNIPRTAAEKRACAAGGCVRCALDLATAAGGSGVVIGVAMAEPAPSANGAAVTDRAG